VFGIACANDVFVQIVKITVVLYLPTTAMQPQLLRIRKVLTDVSLNYINRQSIAGHDRFEGGRSEEEVEELRVVQHMSAACRASRSDELKGLPSAWLLRQVKIVFLSPSISLPFYPSIPHSLSPSMYIAPPLSHPSLD
jgi:hypothetical protein